MPKVVTQKTRMEIIEFAKSNPQTITAKEFNVSRMFVNALFNGRKIKRTHGRRYKCPITGY